MNYEYKVTRKTRLYSEEEIKKVISNRKKIKSILFKFFWLIIPAPIIIWALLWLINDNDTIKYMTFWSPYLTYFGTVLLGLVAYMQNKKAFELNNSLKWKEHLQNKPIFVVNINMINSDTLRILINNFGGIAFNSYFRFENVENSKEGERNFGAIINTANYPDLALRIDLVSISNEKNRFISFAITYVMVTGSIDTARTTIDLTKDIGKTIILVSDEDYDWQLRN